MTDPIDRAIAATESRPMLALTISGTGRVLYLPTDLTVPEVAELAVWAAAQVSNALMQVDRAQRAKAVMLATPRGPIAIARKQ